jgi:hypothetical protein
MIFSEERHSGTSAAVGDIHFILFWCPEKIDFKFNSSVALNIRFVFMSRSSLKLYEITKQWVLCLISNYTKNNANNSKSVSHESWHFIIIDTYLASVFAVHDSSKWYPENRPTIFPFWNGLKLMLNVTIENNTNYFKALTTCWWLMGFNGSWGFMVWSFKSAFESYFWCLSFY